MNIRRSVAGQAMPAETVKLEKDAFRKQDGTTIAWLGGAGIFINARGTNIMVDPVLEGFDMPLLIDQAITPEEVPVLDAVLITHIDNDHFSKLTLHDLEAVTRSIHAPQYVAEDARNDGLSAEGHGIGEHFTVSAAGGAASDALTVTLTPTRHNWQNYLPEYNYREWKEEDYCGFRIETPDGVIWVPGDSQPIPALFTQEAPDAILFDFSDNDWHIGFEGAVKMAATYPDAKLICIHWGTVDAPEFTPFNGDPERIRAAIINPERLYALAPGELLTL